MGVNSICCKYVPKDKHNQDLNDDLEKKQKKSIRKDRFVGQGANQVDGCAQIQAEELNRCIQYLNGLN